jgi:integrase
VEALQELLSCGFGISTSNGYLCAIKGFSRWLMRDRRTGEDPLAMLSRLNAKTDVRHKRRALPEEELRALLAAAGSNPAEFRELTGPDRAMLYALAMTTGCRVRELASLTPKSFEFDGDGPTVTVRAGYSKNRREAVQPLPLDVAAALRAYLVGRPVDQPVWPGEWYKDAAEMLREDLGVAGIPYRNEEGQVCDAHALRHGYITLLERSGVSPKLAQELARHSDIRLTMNVYAHARLHDLASAVEGLPSLLSDPGPGKQTQKATGTDGRPARLDRALTKRVRSNGVRLIVPDKKPAEECLEGADRNPLGIGVFATGCDSMRTDEGKLPGQDSNLDKENQNLLCYRYTTG